jgi:hypothetical protein
MAESGYVPVHQDSEPSDRLVSYDPFSARFMNQGPQKGPLVHELAEREAAPYIPVLSQH